MAEETARKTLANCSAIEGLKQMNLIRREVKEFYDLMDIDKIKKKHQMGAENKSAQEIATAFSNDLFDAMLDVNAEKTVEIIGLLAFMDREEALKLSLSDAYGIIAESMRTQICVDFFSSVVSSVTSVTGTT